MKEKSEECFTEEVKGKKYSGLGSLIAQKDNFLWPERSSGNVMKKERIQDENREEGRRGIRLSATYLMQPS